MTDGTPQPVTPEQAREALVAALAEHDEVVREYKQALEESPGEYDPKAWDRYSEGIDNAAYNLAEAARALLGGPPAP